ncbi:MAG: hypothetical protein ACRDGQ_06650 [Candidatus Limnocylindrales bacterium]
MVQEVLFERRANPRDGQDRGAWSSVRRFSLVRMIGEAERRDRFGYALRRAMAAKAITGRGLARKMQLDPRKIEGWRAGKNLPNLYQTQELVAILGVKEELFRNPPAVPPEPYYPIQDYLLGATDEATGSAPSDPDQDPPTPIRRAPRRPPRQSDSAR